MSARASTAIKLEVAVYAGGALLCPRRGAAGRRGHFLRQAVRAGATDTSVGGSHRADADTGAGLAALVYELLDAHRDTAQLADRFPYNPSLAAHHDYLRVLRRKRRKMLARMPAKEHTSCRWIDSRLLDVR